MGKKPQNDTALHTPFVDEDSELRVLMEQEAKEKAEAEAAERARQEAETNAQRERAEAEAAESVRLAAQEKIRAAKRAAEEAKVSAKKARLEARQAKLDARRAVHRSRGTEGWIVSKFDFPNPQSGHQRLVIGKPTFVKFDSWVHNQIDQGHFKIVPAPEKA